MIRVLRSFLTLGSAFGLGASVCSYMGSYSGTTMDSLSRWAAFLHLGTIVLILPMVAVEYPALKDRTLFWEKFARGRPKWVVPAMQVLGLFFFVHFVVFLVQSHAAGPGIKNGEYVLESHGRLVSVITKAEYLKLKAAELRIFATGWIFFYFVSTVYWWFLGDHREKAARTLPGQTADD